MNSRDHVLLFVRADRTRRLLQRLLGAAYELSSGATPEDLGRPFELAVLDAFWLRRLAPLIAARRAREEPQFLPFLLVCAPASRALAGVHLGAALDDVVYTPVQAAELQARVKVLLHTRALSVESRRAYFELADASPVALVLLQDDRILYANSAFIALAGLESPEQAVGASLPDAIHPADVEQVRAHCARVLQERRPGAGGNGVEARIMGREGSRWVEFRTSPVTLRGKPALLVLLPERTERKVLDLIQEAMAGKRGSFDELCARLVKAVSREFKLEHVGICVRHGTSLRVLACAGSGELSTLPGAACSGTLCRAALEDGQVHSGSVEAGTPCPALLRSGVTRRSSIVAVPIKTEGEETVGVICAAATGQQAFGREDTTLLATLAQHTGRQFEIDALRSDRARTRRMELLGKLTSGVAHEVRNPINAILATAEALELDVGADAEHGESIRHIREQVERIALLMRDLLDLGKPVPDADRSVWPLGQVCAQAVALWRKTTQSQGSSVRILADADAESARVFVDRNKIQQVILNLLDNAAQHSPQHAEILFRLLAASETLACFRITDGGTGLTETDLRRVFDPFYTRRKEGTGLGLSIVKHIVESHGGTVSIRNNAPAPGCTVEVSLPVSGY